MVISQRRVCIHGSFDHRRIVFVDGFASLYNVTDVFHRAAPVGIVAVGMTFVVISGNYLDLSVVAQVATAGVILIAVSNTHGIFIAMVAALMAAILFALVNGIAVGVFKANAVIVTLATTFIGLGVLRYFSGGSIFFGPPDGIIKAFGMGKVGPIPYSAIVLLVMTILLSILLNRTNFGFLIRSFGVNESATRLGGSNTALIVFGAFLVTAIAAMVAGLFLLLSRTPRCPMMVSDMTSVLWQRLSWVEQACSEAAGVYFEHCSA